MKGELLMCRGNSAFAVLAPCSCKFANNICLSTLSVLYIALSKGNTMAGTGSGSKLVYVTYVSP